MLSKKSQFYRKRILYNKNKVKTDISALEHFLNKNEGNVPQNYKERLKQTLDSTLETFNYYERNLFLLYYESNLTYNELADETGIPKISIFNTVRKVKTKIKELVNVCTE